MRSVNGTVAAARDVPPGRDVAHGRVRPDLRIARPSRPETAAGDAELRRRVSAERQSLAGALHDEIGPLLFAIAASTQRAQVLHGDDLGELRRTVDEVADRVRAASDRLRELLAAAAPADDDEAVLTAVERDLSDLRRRADLAATLIVRGRVRRLAARVERTLLGCLRQALFNIERHADAASVVVTVDYTPDQVTLVVLDDGRGVDPELALAGVPEGDRRWGFTSMARQVEQNGGDVTLQRLDGGTSLRLRLPV